jgi:SH3-like domain-containing protein
MKTSALITACLLALMPAMALALDFRSVAVPKAVLFDAPSSAAKKVLLLNQHYPVEVVVNLGEWLKVRDAEGSLNWVEAKQLSNKRTVLVKQNQAEIKQSADANAKVLATVDKEVLLELVDAKPNNGWLKVKHRDGLVGYLPIGAVWGAE